MEGKRAVLKEADGAYEELREAIAGLDESQMRRVWLGTWGVREILIHISGWHREMVPAFRRIARGEPPYPDGVSYDDSDAWNARFVEAKGDAKVVDVLAELEASHRDFVDAATALADAHFVEKAPARELFEGAGAPHYREHAAQIRRGRHDGASTLEA